MIERKISFLNTLKSKTIYFLQTIHISIISTVWPLYKSREFLIPATVHFSQYENIE